MFIPWAVVGCFREGNLVVKAHHRESTCGLWNISYAPLGMKTIVIHSLCFFQAQLQMLWDSHIFGWPSSWLLLCACCLLLPHDSCQWPSGHQKVIRYRKKKSSPNSERLSQKSKHFSKAAFLQNSKLLGSLVWKFFRTTLFFNYKNYEISKGK